MTTRLPLAAALVLAASGGLCPPLAGAAEPSATPAAGPAFAPDKLAFYEKEVKPLLAAHCLKCHGEEPKKLKGGLDLTRRSAVVAGGDTGPAFDPARPGESLILKAISYKDENNKMPPKGQLPDKDVAVLTKWVGDGLAMPGGDAGVQEPPPAHAKGGVVTEEAKRYWAYRPVVRPAVPDVKDKGWVRTPVDAFVLSKLEAKGLKPVAPAGRVALVRRAYYDLLGLPPTPEQVDAFVNDPSPEAWPKLVDSLLASPHYGEKWGRHWLDVVRYAETNGYERDGPKPFAWKYRDYVVKSFNDDKPYDQFVREQVAGDERPGGPAEAVAGTGFYRLGLWDDEPADREQALFDGYDDLVATAGQGFLGMTLNCARCHDHKVDPIPQADYYRLLAFFRDVRPFSYDQGPRGSSFSDVAADAQRKAFEPVLAARHARLKAVAAAMAAIEDAALKSLPAEDQRAAEGPERERVVRLRVVPQLAAGPKAEYAALKKERAALEKAPSPAQDLVLSVNHGDPSPPPTHVMLRGNPHAPGKAVTPGFPEVLGGGDAKVPAPKPGAKSSGRRTLLADWLASPDNQLVARVLVNRVWQHHFGKGIVPTANDFGKLGERPTHPELLDWLASEFVKPSISGGTPFTVKRLHRLVMLSNAYQLSAAADAAALKSDPANSLLWRANMRRLSAEEVRDSVLLASGKLKLDVGGPSVYPRIPAEVLAGQSVPGNGWLATRGGGYDPKNPDAGNRRSLYVHVKRSLQVPILANHDQADTDSSCPVRYTTTVPTQALGLLNGEFAQEQAAAFAERLAKAAPNDLPAQVARGLRLTTGRVPPPDEVAKDAAFVTALKAKHGLDDAKALAQYALLLLNANEFVYLD